MRDEREPWEPASREPGFRFGFGFTPVVKWIIGAEFAAFLLSAIANRVATQAEWTVLDDLWQTRYLALSARGVIDHFHVWQLATSLFMHADVWHLFWNLLAFYFMGPIVEPHYGARRFLYLFFGAGLAGGVAFIVPHYFWGQNAVAVGASGAVMGVTIAAAVLHPNMQFLFMFLFPMRLRTLAILLVACDLYIIFFQQNSPIASSAHLGGAFFGFAFVRLQPRVSEWFFRIERRLAAKEHRRSLDTRQKVEELLEKIHRQGMDKLSRREKNFLRKASEEYRERRS
ncbi:MAG: rhomboid family intramembrane serine protease [Planctomycetes bacterium]|nr:rhomboid family intramembrane serine protease [Planctomycetota bacterium]